MLQLNILSAFSLATSYTTNTMYLAKNKQQRINELKSLHVNSINDIKTLNSYICFNNGKLLSAIVTVNGIKLYFESYQTFGFLEYWADSIIAFHELKDAIQLAITSELSELSLSQ